MLATLRKRLCASVLEISATLPKLFWDTALLFFAQDAFWHEEVWSHYWCLCSLTVSIFLAIYYEALFFLPTGGLVSNFIFAPHIFTTGFAVTTKHISLWFLTFLLHIVLYLVMCRMCTILVTTKTKCLEYSYFP